MKTLKYKAYCIAEITDDLNKMPTFFSKTKSEAIWGGTSHFGHPCDDPLKRGALCEVEVILKVPEMPKVTDSLREYVAMTGFPAVLTNNENWNKRARKVAGAELRRKIKRLAK